MKTMSSEILVWLSKFQLVERRMTRLLEIISMYKLWKRFMMKKKKKLSLTKIPLCKFLKSIH